MKSWARRLTTLAVILGGAIGTSAALAATVQLWSVTADSTGVHYVPAVPYLGKKAPLIVIHGLNTNIQSPEIKGLTDKLAADPTVTARFQVFTLEYDTFTGIDENAQAFAQHLPQILSDRQFTIIGHSVGGLVARGALELYGGIGAGSLMDRLDALFTFGTPHHGSPFANEAWTRATAAKDPLLSLLLSAAEQATGLVFASAGAKDMAWDDFDHTTPVPFQTGKSGFLERLNAAFLSRPDAPGRKYHLIGGSATTLPTSLTPLLAKPNDKSLQYATLGWVMGRLMLEDPANLALLANDGIVPLSSSLFLNVPDATSPSAPIAQLINQATTVPQGYYLVDIQPNTVMERQPAVRSLRFLSPLLHFDYPLNAEVYRMLLEELKVTGSNMPPPAVSFDIDGDGKVTVRDALISLAFVVGTQTPTAAEIAAVDADHDGKIGVADVIHILRKAVGLE